MLDILSAIIANKVNGGSGSSGGGLPEGGEPHQMLVTDADGKTVWEERTHYRNVEQVEAFPLSTVEMIEQDGMRMAQVQLSNKIDVNIGSPVVVTWDGTQYKTKVADLQSGRLAIGNEYVLGMGEDTGEPFFAVLQDEMMLFFAQDAASSHTVHIVGEKTTIKQMGKEYLPDPEPTVFTVNFTLEEDGSYVADTRSSDVVDMLNSGLVTVVARVPGVKSPSQVAILQCSTITPDRDVCYMGFAIDNAMPAIRYMRHIGTTGKLTMDELWEVQVRDLLINTGTYAGLKIKSSTSGSDKVFFIKVDDSGTLTATEVTT